MPLCIASPAQVDVRVFVDMPEANETTEGSVPNYAGLMTWLHDHMSKGGKSRAGWGATARAAGLPARACELRASCTAQGEAAAALTING